MHQFCLILYFNNMWKIWSFKIRNCRIFVRNLALVRPMLRTSNLKKYIVHSTFSNLNLFHWEKNNLFKRIHVWKSRILSTQIMYNNIFNNIHSLFWMMQVFRKLWINYLDKCVAIELSCEKSSDWNTFITFANISITDTL